MASISMGKSISRKEKTVSTGYFHRVHALTETRCWINNPTRQEAAAALQAGITNCTTNPTYAMKQIQREPDMAEPILDRICRDEKDDNTAAALIQREFVRHLISIFGPLYNATTRSHGLVSLQGDPILEDNSEVIVDEALESRALGPNYAAKIPTTRAGLVAMKVLIALDVPIIATEIMSLSQVVAVCELYNEVSLETGKKPPLYVTHITGIFDDHIQNEIRDGGIEIESDISFQAGTAVARKLYNFHRARNYPGIVLGGGARGLHHFTEFVGGNIHVTMNWKDSVESLIGKNPPVIERIATPVPEYVIDELLSKIPDFRLAWEVGALAPEEFEDFGPVQLFRRSFVEGWNYLLSEIRRRR